MPAKNIVAFRGAGTEPAAPGRKRNGDEIQMGRLHLRVLLPH